MAHPQGNRRRLTPGAGALAAMLLAASLGLPASAAPASSQGAAKAKAAAPAGAPGKAKAKKTKARSQASRPTRKAAAAAAPIQAAGNAEARLIAVYELFGRGQSREALAKARELVRAYPHFQLAQLVYGDLLAAQVPPTHALSDTANIARLRGDPALADLHEESRRRLQALRDRPPPGTVPSQFLALSARSRHAIAVDASRSRLYLLENGPQGLRVVADYYISVGKAGIDKQVEGDARTPLGVYHVTSNLDPRSLRDFYGAGALPINYPNAYDQRRGRTGSGIWLHGTPPQQYARAPLASDGCVVMANPDLRQLVRRVQVGATPVVIAQRLEWIEAPRARTEAENFDRALMAWRDARHRGDADRLAQFYLPDFQQRKSGPGKAGNSPQKEELAYGNGRNIQLKDISYLRWKDQDDTMVATFGEVAEGEKKGRLRRQYWLRQHSEWKLFYEDVLG